MDRKRSLLLLGQAAPADAPPVVYDPDAVALFARMSAQPNAFRKGLISGTIMGMKADGVWAKLNRLGVFAAHTDQASLLDWKNSAKVFTTSGGITFTTDRGWQGNATDGYLDFGETLSAAGNGFAQNDAHGGAWCNLDSGTGGSQSHLGDIGSPSVRLLIQAGKTAADSCRVNDAGTSSIGAISATRVGHRVAVRADSANKTAYRDGVNLGSAASASVGVSTGNATVLRSQSVYSSDRIAAIHTGVALTDTDVANLHARLSTFLTAIGGA